MVSYSWDDAVAAELIHEELALRGFAVIHDRCSFPLGGRIGQNMADGVASCDAFVAYLTPSSLYLDKPEGSPRPAIDNEFLPMMRRWRSASSAERRGGGPPPVVVALTHGLGEPRVEAPQKVFESTGEDISSLWSPMVLDQSTHEISQPEAAALAASVVRAVLTKGRRQVDGSPLEMVVVTRGQGQTERFLTVDATPSLGGRENRIGQSFDWERLLLGLSDVQAALAHWTSERRLHVLARAHLSACLLVGRVFNQAAGWRISVEGRHGVATLPSGSANANLEVVVDRVHGRGAMSVEIDLVQSNVVDLATAAIRTTGVPPCARIQVRQLETGDLHPGEIGAAAAAVAADIRALAAEMKPELIRIFCAAPADFAVLLGTRLTSLHADLQLYERDGSHYIPTLLVPSGLV